MRTSILPLALLFLTGCAAGVQTRQVARFPSQSQIVENSDLARLYVIRPPGDGPFTFLVKDGSKRIGVVHEAGYLCWERPPGDVVLASHFDEYVDTCNLNVQKSTVYYVRQKIAHRAFGHARTKLEILNETEGIKLLQKCRPPIANSELAKGIQTKEGVGVDLTRYTSVTVLPFTIEPGKSIDPAVGADFGDAIHEILKASFSSTFQDVRFGLSSKSAEELVIKGTIKAYSPGSRLARYMIVGAGAAGFDVELELMDAATGKTLLTAPLNKVWAWGGMAGAAKGVDDMFMQSALACAATVAQGKGWNPK